MLSEQQATFREIGPTVTAGMQALTDKARGFVAALNSANLALRPMVAIFREAEERNRAIRIRNAAFLRKGGVRRRKP